MYIDNPKKIIEIHKWKSKTKQEISKIDFIYQDDQIEVAIKKLLEHFQLNDIYVWTDDEIIEFNTSIKLNNINPFYFDTSQDIKTLKITEKKGIFNYQKINIVDKEVFKDDKIILKVFFKYSRPTININEKRLNEIYKQSLQSEIFSTIIVNYELNTTIKLDYTLKYYYRTINSNFDITGWIYDNVNKHFTVKNSKDYSDIVSDLNKNQYTQEQLIFIKYLSYFKSYYIITVTNNEINVKLVLGNKTKYSIENVLTLKQQIEELLTTMFNQTIVLNDKMLKSQIDFRTPNFSLNLFNQQLSLIYNFVSKQDKIYIYNRTSNNNDSYDIENYIKELYKNSKTVEEIVEILFVQLTEKFTKEDLTDLVQSIIEGLDYNKDKYIYFTRKTFFTIRKSDKMYISVTIDNISSLIELNYFNFWLSRISYNSMEKKLTIQEIQEIKEKSKSSSSSAEFQRSSNSDEEDSLSFGGMPKKENDIKQLNYLQALDPQLFNKKELYKNKTYAQTCQGNRQPMGLPTQKFQKYKDSVDNYLEINNNTYFCPRYWCLKSDQPILDKTKQTCENGETPIDIYSTKKGTFNKPDTPRYVSYYSKEYPKPCCYLKNNQIVLKEEPKSNVKQESQSALSASNIHIFTTYNVVPENRYGMLPKSILKLIDNKTPGLVCSDKLKSKKCAYRMGINKKNRDLMDILTKMLNYEKRHDLVKAIYNNLDLIKFISLENGEIAREFMKKAFYKNYKKIDKKVLDKNYNINISPASRKTIDYSFNAYIED